MIVRALLAVGAVMFLLGSPPLPSRPWDPQNVLKPRPELKVPSEVTGLAFCGSRLLLAATRQEVMVWRLEDGYPVKVLPPPGVLRFQEKPSTQAGRSSFY